MTSALRLLRRLLGRPPLRLTEEEAIEVVRKDYAPGGDPEGFRFEAQEHLAHWEVRVIFPLAGPLAGRYEIDGQTGTILNRVIHEM